MLLPSALISATRADRGYYSERFQLAAVSLMQQRNDVFGVVDTLIYHRQ